MLFFVGWVERSGTQHQKLGSVSQEPNLQKNGYVQKPGFLKKPGFLMCCFYSSCNNASTIVIGIKTAGWAKISIKTSEPPSFQALRKRLRNLG